MPLTAGPAHDFQPVWSPDGKSIAYASDAYGNFDVFLIPAAGGAPKRLTTHSADEVPTGFTPDGKSVLFSAHRQDAGSTRSSPAAASCPSFTASPSSPATRPSKS